LSEKLDSTSVALVAYFWRVVRRATMTYKDFQDCLKEYKAALLNIIPDFYEEENTSNFPSIHNVNGNTYFRSSEMLKAKIKARKSTPLKYPEDEAKRKKELYSLKEDLKQNERWVVKCSGFIEYMTHSVLVKIDPIAKECTPLLFRFRFLDEEVVESFYSSKMARSEFKKSIQRGLDKGKDDDMAFSIFVEFMIYLKLLKDKYDKYEASGIIQSKMGDQEMNYLKVYGDRIKKFLGSKSKNKSKYRISDSKFKELVKDAAKEGIVRDEGEIRYFKELSKMSKSNLYDKTQKGYTQKSVKKRYYEVFPSK
jgi:hypothetical protein